MIIKKSKNGRHIIDLSGQRFGRLLVLEYVEQNKHHESVWRCQCDCGTVKNVVSKSLRDGDTRSCGCLQRDVVSKPEELRSRKTIYYAVRGGAKSRGIVFDLSVDDVDDLSKQNCFYCGKEPSYMYARRGKKLKYNGIDRVNSSKGYVKGNVVPCCPDCNYAKREMNVQGFVTWIDRLSKGSFFLLQKFGGRFCSPTQSIK